MKKILALIIAAFSLASCSESFLDTENLTKKDDVSFYETPEDVALALTAAYAVLPDVGASQNSFLVSELMSDDRFGGGGDNDRGFHAISVFKKENESMYEDAWGQHYRGIFRTNMIISKLDQVKWTSDDQRGKAEGEARFLRAYFYFDLARMFGTVPLVVETAPVNLPKASPEEIFAQIATDLKFAIESFPATNYNSIPATELGHATKWAAEGLMARTFLFYTGYYQKTELPLVDGGSVSKGDVIGWIDDCVANSGHDLIPDFRNLWPYSYSNKDYGYAKNNNLSWIGDGKANKETVFALKYSTIANDWGATLKYSNQIDLYFGWRNQTQIPFGQGWGAGPVNPQFYDESTWEANDVRRKGSICDVNDVEEGISGYIPASDKQYHETGLWQKKYMPINIKYTDANGDVKTGNMSIPMGANESYQLNNSQDIVLIRFADILLMGAELGSANAQTYMDRVRTRARLASVAPTLENIKIERRHELAFEGIRYYDLLRWQDVESAMAKVTNVPVKNNGVAATYSKHYRPETGGFLQIPNTQIALSNGELVQNPGWDGADALYSGE